MTAPLRDLTPALAGTSSMQPLLVRDLRVNSREINLGDAFVALAGRHHHGIEFAEAAIEAGARAIVYEPVTGMRLPALRGEVAMVAVPDLARRLGEIADRFYGMPSKTMTIAAVTGTNGKTTCAWLLAQALSRAGMRSAYSGTLGVGPVDSLRATRFTTADAATVQRQLAELRAEDTQCVAMEVSSHALDQHRVAGVRFAIAAFTNLSHDHLDYHGEMTSYFEAKERLFRWPTLRAAVVNVDDAHGARLAAGRAADLALICTSRLGVDAPRGARELRGTALQLTPNGIALEIGGSFGAAHLRSSLLGEFNADNLLTVLGVLIALDVPLARAVEYLAEVTPPPGRMQLLRSAGRALAVVDYAHTPDALAKALDAARAHCSGRLWVVFGCGGDRDRAKRGPMGAAAARLADAVILTDDNPRSESPQAIVADIAAAVPAERLYRIEHDRATAIRLALNAAADNDVVVVAGKGHEDYQIYGAERRPFSDQGVIERCFAEAA
ncbi:MAG: UDP-N-acetylmuramoyl-L-alanyl-D-glutamate--2,6-diaminopimelate ligase [Steroidobacteraceae bacterium]